MPTPLRASREYRYGRVSNRKIAARCPDVPRDLVNCRQSPDYHNLNNKFCLQSARSTTNAKRAADPKLARLRRHYGTGPNSADRDPVKPPIVQAIPIEDRRPQSKELPVRQNLIFCIDYDLVRTFHEWLLHEHTPKIATRSAWRHLRRICVDRVAAIAAFILAGTHLSTTFSTIANKL
jgi:hypothetical protein